MGRRLPFFLTPPVISRTAFRTSYPRISTCQFRGNAVFFLPFCERSSSLRYAFWHNPSEETTTISKVIASADAVESLVLDTQVPVSCGADIANVSLRVDNLGGRRRRISGGVDINESAQRVWDVLTRYECNEKYMPNIKKSDVERLNSGDILLDQVGVISRTLGLRTRMVMRVKEDFGNFRITFSKAEGRDFTEFEGRYVLRVIDSEKVRLEYEITAVPIPIFPVSMVERKITKEVPGMLASIRQEAMEGNFVPF